MTLNLTIKKIQIFIKEVAETKIFTMRLAENYTKFY